MDKIPHSTLKTCWHKLKGIQLEKDSPEEKFLNCYNKYIASRRHKESKGIQEVLSFLLQCSFKKMKSEQQRKVLEDRYFTDCQGPTQDEYDIRVLGTHASRIRKNNCKPWSLEFEFLKCYTNYQISKLGHEANEVQHNLLMLTRQAYTKLQQDKQLKKEEEKNSREHMPLVFV